MTESDGARSRLDRSLDEALRSVLRAPGVPATLRTRLDAALSQAEGTDLSALRRRLESERRQQFEALQAGYLRVQRGTLGTLIGVAFAAGAASAIAMPWLRAHLGAYTPMAITWAGAALGLGMVFFEPLRSLLRRWSDIG